MTLNSKLQKADRIHQKIDDLENALSVDPDLIGAIRLFILSILYRWYVWRYEKCLNNIQKYILNHKEEFLNEQLGRENSKLEKP